MEHAETRGAHCGAPSRGATHSRKTPFSERMKHIFGRGFVLFLAGLLFAGSMTFRPSVGSRYDSDLLSLVARKEAAVKELSADNEEMYKQIDQMITAVPDQPQLPVSERTRVELAGPGVTVTLNDAPIPEPLPEGVVADDLVIHQQDIEAVFNALRSGGAEALSVQGRFVRADSKVSCVGNVINIDGKLYSPPYEIGAIGDAAKMRGALAQDPQIAVLGEYVARFNLGYSVRDEAKVRISAVNQQPVFNFVKVTANNDN
ncbi:DUF881 domain-containing protein [Actinomyces urinae]|uniref:DUF881 domain-containing protein n=1 Tax=Actinomyces urinae TaxID=1689268 RepID=UPI0009F809D2|nr:DUF881 domain-containing protein [Actinomyces urinae]